MLSFLKKFTSLNTLFKISSNLAFITSDDFSGRYNHYRVRDHAMAAAMNGLALHRGAIPY